MKKMCCMPCCQTAENRFRMSYTHAMQQRCRHILPSDSSVARSAFGPEAAGILRCFYALEDL